MLPTIRNVVCESSEPTHSLKRFDKAIRHAHARLRASEKRPDLAPIKPVEPIFNFDGEDPDLIPFRQALANTLGPQAYSRYCHGIRFTTDIGAGNRRVLKARKQANSPFQLLDDRRGEQVRKVASEHGFNDVWET